MSLSNKEQGMLIAFVVAAILFAGGWFLTKPQIEVWPQNKAELADVKAENARRDSELVREATIDTEILQAYDDSVKAGGFFYDEMNAPTADQTVRNFLLNSGAGIRASDLTKLSLDTPVTRELKIEATPDDIKFPDYAIANKADIVAGRVAATTPAPDPNAPPEETAATDATAPLPVITEPPSEEASEAKVLYDDYAEKLSHMDSTSAINFFKEEEATFAKLTETERANRRTALVGAMAQFLATANTMETVGAYDVKVTLYLKRGMFTKLQDAAIHNTIAALDSDGKTVDVRKAIAITKYSVQNLEWNGVTQSLPGVYDFTVSIYCVRPISKPPYLIQLEKERGDAGLDTPATDATEAVTDVDGNIVEPDTDTEAGGDDTGDTDGNAADDNADNTADDTDEGGDEI